MDSFSCIIVVLVSDWLLLLLVVVLPGLVLLGLVLLGLVLLGLVLLGLVLLELVLVFGVVLVLRVCDLPLVLFDVVGVVFGGGGFPLLLLDRRVDRMFLLFVLFLLRDEAIIKRELVFCINWLY